jgi:CHAT domain-containing protein
MNGQKFSCGEVRDDYFQNLKMTITRSMETFLFRFTLMLCISGFFPISGRAQQDMEDWYPLLESQMDSFQLRHEVLMVTRGNPWYTSGPVDVEKITQALADFDQGRVNPTAMLFYFYDYGEKTLYVWALSRRGILGMEKTLVPSTELSALENDMKISFRVQAARGAELFEEQNEHMDQEQIIRKASQLLFPESIIKVLERHEEILLIPTLNISSLPLYCLKPFPGSGDYLVDRKTISVAESLDNFLNKVTYYCLVKQICGQRGVFIPERPLVVGNPDFSNCSEKFSPLPGAQKEAEEIAQKIGARLITGSAAQKNRVRDLIKKSEFIYLATHGFADKEDPMNKSFLLFYGNGAEADCGYLTPTEIQRDSLMPESIVVLSACQTGLGKTLDAGIIGLGRSFIKAQASNVIMSLWNVDDAATQKMMGLFGEELFTPQPFFPATALRKAMLRYKEQDSLPAHWGAFTSMGNPFPGEYSMQMKK